MLRLELEKELGRVRGELLKRETGPGSEEKGKGEGEGEVEWVEWFVGVWGVFEGRVVSSFFLFPFFQPFVVDWQRGSY